MASSGASVTGLLDVRAASALAAALVISAGTARAQGPSPPAPTLHDVVTFALTRNADVVTARLHIDSAHAERRIARSFTDPVGSVIPGVPFQYGLATDVDIGPGRWYRIRAASQGFTATRYDYNDVARQVAFNVRQGYLDLLLADALATVATDERDILHTLLVADSARLRNGDIPQSEVVTSELNLARAESGVAKAQVGVRAARIQLQLLMGVPTPDTGFRVAGTLRFESVDLPVDHPDSLVAVATEARPDLKSADEKLDQSRSIREETGWLLLPTPNVGLTWQPQQPYPGAFPFGRNSHFTLALGMPVPLWNWYGGERERATAGVGVARVAANETERQVVSDVIRAADSLRSAEVLAKRYQGGLLDKTNQAVQTARYAYQRGAISLLDLLDAIRTNQDIRTEYLTAVHDYWVAAFGVDRAVGRDLVTDGALPQ